MVNFTAMASGFDTSRRQLRAKIIADTISEYLGSEIYGKGMDYGCGTGLVGFNVLNNLKEVLFVDPSPGMVKEVQTKIDNNTVKNAKVLCGNLLHGLEIPDTFDCIFSSMAFHHEPDVELLFRTLFGYLRWGGRLVIVDLDKNDGGFHADEPDFIGHHGFSHNYLYLASERAGFLHTTIKTFYWAEREVNNRKIPYSLFCLCADKE